MNHINFINGTRSNTKIKLTKYNRIINNLKRRIFVAKQQGRFRIMRKLQNLLIKAHSNRLITVKNAYQIPNSNSIFVQEQENLITKLKEINLNKWKPKVKQLLCHPKIDNHRLNNIEVLMDRSLQILIKNALEPEWKAIYQKNFSRFNCPRDVIHYINYLNNTQSMKKWIIRVKIKNRFDCLSKNFLNTVFHSFPAKKMIQLWLKIKSKINPYVDVNVNRQDNIINGLLTNIIFDEIKNMFSILNTNVTKIHKKNTIVHYNNEFILSCKTKKDALRIKEKITSLLKSYGLLISNLQIQHISKGFNFLGFHFCVYKNNNKYGKQELKIEPSKESVFKIKKKLKKIWMKSNGFSISKIIKNINPLILRWAHYFKIGKSSKILKLLDLFMYRRQLCFTKKAHPKKSVKWIEQRYRRSLYLGHKKKLVFGCKETGNYMLKFRWI